MRYASVYPLLTTRAAGVARPFTYAVEDGVARGAVLQVPFANARRRGVVVAVGDEPPPGVDVAPAERLVEALPPTLVDLALWLAE
ncbi:MAG TPA: hypothetical protein VK874_05050, partial [Gaiellaceae bacterium]|nr:hypothetical protein [Gaiellaceae bacterium]